MQAHVRQGKCQVSESPGAEDPVPVRLHQLLDEPDRVRHLQHEPQQEEEARTHHCHTNQFLVQAIRPEYL